MTANFRAALYAVVAAIFVVLIGYDLLAQERATELLDLVDKVLALVALVIAYRHTPSMALPGTATPGDVDSDPGR